MKLLHGDCIEIMRTLPECSIDSVVTDPPYELLSGSRNGSGRSNEPDNPYGRHGSQGGGFMGLAWDATGVAFDPATWREALRVLKPGGHLLAFGGTRTYHRLACAIEDAGFEIRDQIAWMFGSGFPKSHNLDGEWEGWGTALKPGHEPIVVARKPLVGTVAANVSEHGTGALNIDGCRIEGGEGGTRDGEASVDRRYRENGSVPFAMTPGPRGGDARGRWPSNVILDEEAAADLDEQSGTLVSGADPTRRGSDKFRDVYGDFAGQEEAVAHRGKDVGGASRFFYVAKASRTERNAGLDGFDESHVFDREAVSRHFEKAGSKSGPQRNHHPTVKPIELMRYLVRLVTPMGGGVLDPFMGSGTTGIACHLEGFEFTGIEREADYLEIAEARIAYFQRFPAGSDLDRILERARPDAKAEAFDRKMDAMGHGRLPI